FAAAEPMPRHHHATAEAFLARVRRGDRVAFIGFQQLRYLRPALTLEIPLDLRPVERLYARIHAIASSPLLCAHCEPSPPRLLPDSSAELRAQRARVPLEMIVHERRDEIVRMIVPGLHPQRDALSRLLRGVHEELGFELTLEILVGVSLLDQDLRHRAS